MKIQSTVIGAVLTWFIMFGIIPSKAQEYGGSGDNPNASFFVTGSFTTNPNGTQFPTFTTTNIANINLSPGSVTFPSYYIFSPSIPTLTMTRQFNVPGTFNFETITATLQLDPFILQLTNWGPASLQFFNGTAFDLVPQPGFANAEFQGVYTIQGPQTTITNTFDVTLPPLNTTTSMPARTIDIGNYPASVSLDCLQNFFGLSSIFSGTVDGVPLNINAAEFINLVPAFTLNENTVIPAPIPSVPEPSAVTLLFLSLTPLVLISRLRSFKLA